MSSATSAFGYGIVIDAGSSGSRISLYRWPSEEGDDGGDKRSSQSQSYARVEAEAVFYDERSVAIHDEERGGLGVLGELLSAAEAALPGDVNPGGVPAYLGATAGVRMQQRRSSDGDGGDAEGDAADAVMEGARSVLRASGFRFRDGWARMISGDEESVYGWLVANYLRDRALPRGDGDGDDSADTATYGALDLGGGSTQISCLVSAPSRTPPPTAASAKKNEETFPLVVGDVQYLLYTRSYLYYGADQARARHDTQYSGRALLSSASGEVNPCYPIGYNHPESKMSGSSDWDGCFDSVSKLFDQRSNLRGGQGQVLDVISPPPKNANNPQEQRFIAMSVFVFIWDFLGLQTGSTTEDLNTLKERARHVCNLTHAQQTEQYDLTMRDKPPSRKTNKGFAQCFNAAYAYHLLSRGYELPVVDTPIEVYYEINGGKVNWALGMMLVEANNLNRWASDVKQQRDGYTYFLGDAAKPTTFLFMGLVLVWLLFLCFNGSERVISLLRRRFSKGKK